MKTSFYYMLLLVSTCLFCCAIAPTAQFKVQWDKTIGEQMLTFL